MQSSVLLYFELFLLLFLLYIFIYFCVYVSCSVLYVLSLCTQSLIKFSTGALYCISFTLMYVIGYRISINILFFFKMVIGGKGVRCSSRMMYEYKGTLVHMLQYICIRICWLFIIMYRICVTCISTCVICIAVAGSVAHLTGVDTQQKQSAEL